MLQGVPANDGLSGTHYRKDVDVVSEAPFGNLFTHQGDVADCASAIDEEFKGALDVEVCPGCELVEVECDCGEGSRFAS